LDGRAPNVQMSFNSPNFFAIIKGSFALDVMAFSG